MNVDTTLEYFRTVSMHRMVNHYLPKFLICLESLDNQMIWDCGDYENEMNNIGGITFHIIEQVTRNTLRLSNPDLKFDKGIENYFPNMNEGKDQLISGLNLTFSKFRTTLETVEPDHIDLFNLYHLVEHTSYHLGQIIDRAQRLTGIQYQFVQNGLNEKELRALVEGN
ncbi:MAG: DinB family protein [Paenibacillus sp.]|nr:DinB family protein [Paenibacillus sp.]